MSATKTFLLGVGAQKAGTTWLHSQLCKNDFFDPGFTKEYHTFDSIYVPEYVNLTASWIKKLNALKNKSGPKINAKKMSLLKRLMFVYEPQSYFDYFDKLASSSPKIKLVGDITPSYSMLDQNALAQIKHGLEEKGFNVKVIFLMRDPVERVWSAKRMQRRHAISTNKAIKSTIETSLIKAINNQGSYLKTDYRRIIEAVKNSFDARQIFFGFFEELFTEHSYERLCKFLELDLVNPDFDKSVNVSPKDCELSGELLFTMAQKYKSTYSYINQYFDGASERLWGKHHHLSQM